MSENKILELRSSSSELSAPSLQSEESRTIEGLAIVYEEESEVLYEFLEGRAFREIVHKGAVTEELLRSSDVLALYEHDRTKLLARSTNGAGSLQLTITDSGLLYRFDAPNTQLGNDTLELLRRGDLRSSSFLFGVNKGDTRWEKKEDGTWLRHIDHFSYIGDVSVVSPPIQQPLHPLNAQSGLLMRSEDYPSRAKSLPPNQSKKKRPPRKLPSQLLVRHWQSALFAGLI